MSGDAANVGVRGAMGVGGMREGRVGGEERRRLVVERLRAAKSPVRGSDLAAEQGVSRQVIVQDIALLRSAGVNVASTNRGYVLVEGGVPAACRRTFKVRHGEDRMADELRLVVDLGGTVEDVVVNHRTYGRVRAPLGIGSRRDIDRFVRDLATSKSAPISRITSGYHFHHVTAPSEEILDEIEDALSSGGYLVERMPYEMGEDL